MIFTQVKPRNGIVTRKTPSHNRPVAKAILQAYIYRLVNTGLLLQSPAAPNIIKFNISLLLSYSIFK